MSAEHRLTAGEAGIYGKHPGFGDFIAAGLPDAVFATLGDWAQAVLGEWREQAGEGWQAAFDGAPGIGFWIGGALTGAAAGGLPLRGVWAASRDRAGRRFPLLVVQAGGAAPVADPSQDFHLAAGHALADLFAASAFDPREAARRLRAELPAPADGPQPAWPGFCAQNPALGPAALLRELAGADHAHAMAGRSYWWFAAGAQGPSGVLACQGWPDMSEMAWLIAGGRDAVPAAEEGGEMT